MSQLGRIGGGVLNANLERQGTNLSFKNLISDDPLLFLEVSGNNTLDYQIGINTDILPSGRVLIINTKIKTDNLITESLSVSDFIIDQNQIQIESGNIFLNSGDLIQSSGIATDNLTIQNNSIVSQNSNVVLTPSANKTVDVYSDFRVFENLFTSQNIVLEGSLIFGDSGTDSVIFNSKIFSSLVPFDDQKQIGIEDFFWKDSYVNEIYLESIFTENLQSLTASVPKIEINQNIVTTNDNSSDLELNLSTVNYVKIENIEIENNKIINILNQNLQLDSSDNGYIKFDNTLGIVFPTIDTINLPNDPQIGETVYNSNTEEIKIWNGTSWIPGIGELPELTENELEDYIVEWTLILD
jgi:hypothetical protein